MVVGTEDVVMIGDVGDADGGISSKILWEILIRDDVGSIVDKEDVVMVVGTEDAGKIVDVGDKDGGIGSKLLWEIQIRDDVDEVIGHSIKFCSYNLECFAHFESLI